MQNTLQHTERATMLGHLLLIVCCTACTFLTILGCLSSAVTMTFGCMVHLHLYDITLGMANKFSPGLFGKSIDAIWHTGIVVYGKEYFFEGGITCVPSATTRFGKPLRVLFLGVTEIPQSVFEQWTMEAENQVCAPRIRCQGCCFACSVQCIECGTLWVGPDLLRLSHKRWVQMHQRHTHLQALCRNRAGKESCCTKQTLHGTRSQWMSITCNAMEGSGWWLSPPKHWKYCVATSLLCTVPCWHIGTDKSHTHIFFLAKGCNFIEYVWTQTHEARLRSAAPLMKSSE